MSVGATSGGKPRRQCKTCPWRAAVPAHGVRSVETARWVAACWADPERRAALETERRELVAGTQVEGRLLDRVDEIMPADLARGPATGVQVAFGAAAKRIYASWEAGAKDDDTALAPTPSWWRPVRCARLLSSKKALITEGKDLSHCVGSYAALVGAGKSVIVSIAVRVGDVVHRSTVELDPAAMRSGEGSPVRQHKARGNAEPPVLCERALSVCLRRWRLRGHRAV